MKIPNNNLARRQRGMMLIDCMVYLGLVFIVLGFAFELFYTCWDNATHFRRTSDQIVGTVKAGEHWREDIRSATGKLRVESLATGEILHIPHANGEVSYQLANGILSRRAGDSAEWREILSGIASSHMEADKRSQVTAWHWEVELTANRRQAAVRPLFTFEAVPPHYD